MPTQIHNRFVKTQMKSRLWTVGRNRNWISLWFKTCEVIYNSSQGQLQLLYRAGPPNLLFAVWRKTLFRVAMRAESSSMKKMWGQGNSFSHDLICTCRCQLVQMNTGLKPPTFSKTEWVKVQETQVNVRVAESLRKDSCPKWVWTWHRISYGWGL